MLLRWLMSPRGLAFDRWLVRVSGHSLLNRVFARQAGMQARPALLLETTGRRSGEPRQVALPYFELDGLLLVVGSKGGMPDDPFWVHNLRANPDVRICLKRRWESRQARIATAEERARLWPQLVATTPTYAGYAERAQGHREIPVVILGRRQQDR
ncbi:MAG TPA: nitroreductase/quinone reductase family protein [Spongiibacteraceae bacterium]|nr:nitroreductase/quinone reductase family protein [Spongiibacteraceae bacterium]HUH37739.1 nitroreductase/quinone reductase family protein [Spongiibacteraceae bacterium]